MFRDASALEMRAIEMSLQPKKAGGALPHKSFLVCLFCLALLALPGAVNADPPIVRVEEDWELVIATPEPTKEAPQVICVIAPMADVECLHATFELNHRTLPDYQAGGLQLQTWCDEQPTAAIKHFKHGVCSTPSETVRWTQEMKLDGGQLTFRVSNGTSHTWGNFGQFGLFRLNRATGLANLNSYDSSVSVANSGVGYAENRVSKLVLKEVRRYSAEGLVDTDSTPKVVHELQ